LDREEMEAAAGFLGGPVSVIAAFSRADIAGGQCPDEDFVEMLSRRPMTAPDLAQALGLPLVEVQKRLQRLLESGLISHNFYGNQGFYQNPAPAR
jgi:hypothetical protein